MGYQRKRKTYSLTFEGTDYDGLTVRIRGASVEQYARALRLQNVAEENEDSIRELLGLFAEALIDWNLEDEQGAPVPTTLQAVLDEDLEMVLAMVSGWLGAIGGVPAPLEQSSPGGGPSPEVSIPMAPLSASLPPLSMPS